MAAINCCKFCGEIGPNILSLGQKVLGKDLIDVIGNITSIQLRALNPLVVELLVCQKCTLGLIQAEAMIEKIRRALNNVVVATVSENKPADNITTAKDAIIKQAYQILGNNVAKNDKGTTQKMKPKSNNLSTATKSKLKTPTPRKRKSTAGGTTPNINIKLAKGKNKLEKTLNGVPIEVKTEEEPKELSIIENDVTTPRNEGVGAPKQISMSTEQVQYHFICEQCPYESDSPKLFKQHLTTEHGIEKPRIFKCRQCSESYQVQRTLQQHISYVHDHKKRPRNFACTECDKAFFHRSALQVHSQSHSASSAPDTPSLSTLPYTCSENDCSKAFLKESALKCHKTLVHTPPCVPPADKLATTHDCLLCGKSYALEEKLIAHMDKVHAGNQLKECLNCSATFRSEKKLQQHISSEKCNTAKQYQCQTPLCNKSFSKESKLRHHMAKSHALFLDTE